MNNIQLINGEMLSELEKLPANSIDLFIIDLPYGQTECHWDSKINLESLWIQLRRLRRNKNTPFLFFCTTMFGIDIINSNRQWFKYDIVWDKINPTQFFWARKMPMRRHEMIYVFYEKFPLYNIEDNHQRTDLERTNYKIPEIYNTYETQDEHYQGNSKVSKWTPSLPNSIFTLSSKPKGIKRKHPTEKPVDLYKWIIKYFSKEGDTILDPCFGSGNSAVASRDLNRNYIGIELDPDYFRKAQEFILGP